MTDVAAPESRPDRGRRRRGFLLVAAVLVVTGMAALPTLDLPVMRELGRITGLGIPRYIELCGRSYEGGGGPRWSLEEVRQHFGVEPVVVEPWLHPDCVPGACTVIGTAGPCHVVIFARTGPDALAAYERQGGP